jgi:hypothetical protein
VAAREGPRTLHAQHRAGAVASLRGQGRGERARGGRTAPTPCGRAGSTTTGARGTSRVPR